MTDLAVGRVAASADANRGFASSDARAKVPRPPADRPRKARRVRSATRELSGPIEALRTVRRSAFRRRKFNARPEGGTTNLRGHDTISGELAGSLIMFGLSLSRRELLQTGAAGLLASAIPQLGCQS